MISEFLRDLLGVLTAVPRVEWGRRHEGPRPLTDKLRRRGRLRPQRSESDRLRLRRIIRAIDVRLPGGPNCYRRALLEMSLDAGAAHEQLHMGLRAHGGPQSGHAWFGSAETPAESYDADFAI
jgi:hypothetical protein